MLRKDIGQRQDQILKALVRSLDVTIKFKGKLLKSFWNVGGRIHID